jgi:MFS family permease
VIAEVVASDSFKTLFLSKDADTRSGTVVALFTGGCFVGAFFASFTDPLGRRGTILMACCIFIVGGIIQTAGVVIEMLYIGRLIAGIGVGFLTMIVSLSRLTLVTPSTDTRVFLDPHLPSRARTSQDQRQDHELATALQRSRTDLRYMDRIWLLYDMGWHREQ